METGISASPALVMRRAEAQAFADREGVEVVIYDARMQGAAKPSYCYGRATAPYAQKNVVERFRPAVSAKP